MGEITTSLRQVEQDPNDLFIGSINRQHLLDIVFEGHPPGGPFATVKQFNDWFSRLPWLRFPNSEDIQDPYRTFLPDTGTIKLTHGDLHQGNIIVSSTGPPRVLVIVDWAHSGWYPDYWEYCKASYTCSFDGDWRNRWIPIFLEPRPEVHEIFAEYTRALGARARRYIYSVGGVALKISPGLKGALMAIAIHVHIKITRD
ncbi:hypothetical protein V500_03881 [Pseudogymnoascus sp. VKM F-4518 (FW-2643)]|nr:hypothetical protein V500_03881 [Pseudogymnoascus sp. VKM F-4518 (FW-2643)]